MDLDLVYLNYKQDRVAALQEIGAALQIAGFDLERLGIRVVSGSHKEETKLFLERRGVRVKVEVNQVFRGTLLEPISIPLVQKAQDLFFTDLELPVLSQDELYASKFVAAMDRQHCRDIFDVMKIWNRGGITPGLLDCFVVYLAGHNRPIHEVLFATKRDLKASFVNEFLGMTRETVHLEHLQRMQSELLTVLPKLLTESHRQFLLSMAVGQPDWGLLPFKHAKDLPAMGWKLANIKRLENINSAKFNLQARELEKQFSSVP